MLVNLPQDFLFRGGRVLCSIEVSPPSKFVAISGYHARFLRTIRSCSATGRFFLGSSLEHSIIGDTEPISSLQVLGFPYQQPLHSHMGKFSLSGLIEANDGTYDSRYSRYRSPATYVVSTAQDGGSKKYMSQDTGEPHMLCGSWQSRTPGPRSAIDRSDSEQCRQRGNVFNLLLLATVRQERKSYEN